MEDDTFMHSDSDLLPPRSRYPLKWARNRQPSPPGGASGPSFCPGLFHESVEAALDLPPARRAARQWVSLIARIANSYSA